MFYFLKNVTFYFLIIRVYSVFVFYSGDKREVLIGKLLRSYSELLGPTFVKICQTLVYRNDLLPQRTLNELKPLLNKCKPEKNLENKIESHFMNVNDIKLIGSGTIAQVYSGYLENKKYVFKVKRTGIDDLMKQDILFLEQWLRFIHKYYPYYNIYKRFNMIKKSVLIQTDFTNEINNFQTFAKVTKKLPDITVPHVYENMCTDEIIVMEFIADDGMIERSVVIGLCRCCSITTAAASNITTRSNSGNNTFQCTFASLVFNLQFAPPPSL